MYNHINNICSPVLALTPFTETIIRTGEQGETGLSGPNVQLISFNSGDDILAPGNFVVGLGVAEVEVDNVLFSQLGVVMNQTGMLSNFEIGYSASVVSSNRFEDFIRYLLFVIKSSNNSGNDYSLQGPLNVFFEILDFPTITTTEEISANKLVIVPVDPPNVNIGDRVVLVVNIITSEDDLDFDSLAVQASVHFTPSV